MVLLRRDFSVVNRVLAARKLVRKPGPFRIRQHHEGQKGVNFPKASAWPKAKDTFLAEHYHARVAAAAAAYRLQRRVGRSSHLIDLAAHIAHGI